MRVEEKREFPVPLKKMWDFTMDFKEWPLWYSGLIEVIAPETGAWEKEGDTVRIAYKLLGRRIEYTCTVMERTEHELVYFVAEPPALPPAHFYFRWRPVDENRVELAVTLETEEPTSFFERIIDRTLVPRIYHRDLIRSIDNLESIAIAGLPE
jgi:hypothetical protein